MKLLPPLPPPRLLPSRPPAASRTAPPPVAIGRPAWRPEPDYPPPPVRVASPASLVERLRGVERSRLVFAGLTFAIVGAIVALFLLESRWGYSPREPKIVYFRSWRADRSAADTAADNAADVARARTEAAAARAYIATLHGGARNAAQAQYDAYLVAQPKSLQPEGFKPTSTPTAKP